ncbi:50S ribosomal protein L11 methyltransferase [Sulfitobacter mediterraneus]|jgi:ribosomal protein L11 methyltransferase|uniref:50S ribosomal protein L11 methyltransferase n=1 Tax=Sulfitobacter mediterraneus TaxID=83219 RepID=UPI001932C6A8|nr:50S ribosomal protein L11 methyltransferase [Sulfitobacter mediterraneus]MBM1631226.1 50S ribosomal protein L11 methyltransferase [Sulfitobacter mediterraneus]MBM1639039.1 50S ribosomal protein L11 methyltransferase [Sulfitobacter mediterraneus]MBM1643088.1 50S ribosomal protein L11 methyltransferase [Sulfitobacter mediterraneus]MBM1647136.1 50S ribosomal protein L11 methyltransferase [Sulfitobacter mediterraneus]MBM1651179.1 50S ribosomal protein L11 methyltransferase [Sulfitobacter medite
MTTFTALTTLTGRDQAYALGDAMERLEPEPTGVGVFEMEDGSGLWEVGGYFEEAPDETALTLLATAMGAKPFVVSELPETDWVAHVRRELAPVEAGRFFVYGSHDADKVPEGSAPLLIEAAMAFGTGHHGTTLGCLRALDRLANEGFHGQNVADIGCGTAVLAMAAARIWPETVLASDIDEVAVDVARANVVANGLEGRVTCVEAAGFDHPDLAAAAPFDLVFANILKGPLVALAPDMAQALQPGGYAILSGILNEQADEVIEVYARSGINLVHRESIVDWTTLTLRIGH